MTPPRKPPGDQPPLHLQAAVSAASASHSRPAADVLALHGRAVSWPPDGRVPPARNDSRKWASCSRRYSSNKGSRTGSRSLLGSCTNRENKRPCCRW
jgi:hypothetical protein